MMALRQSHHSAVGFASFLLLLILSLYMLTQLRSIHHLAHGFLFATAMSLILILMWTLALTVEKRLMLYPLLLWLASAMLMCLILAPALFVTLTDATTSERIVMPVIFMLALASLMTGLAAGICMRQLYCLRAKWLVCAAVMAAALVGLTLVNSQLKRLPVFIVSAREWDERQQLVIDAKAAGKSELTLPQFTYNYSEREHTWATAQFPYLARYYGVEQFDCYPEHCNIVIDSLRD